MMEAIGRIVVAVSIGVAIVYIAHRLGAPGVSSGWAGGVVAGLLLAFLKDERRSA